MVLTSTSGEVECCSTTPDSLRMVSTGDTLTGNVELKTGLNASAEVRFGNGISIIIGERSFIDFSKMLVHKRKKIYRTTLNLRRGQMWIEAYVPAQERTIWFDVETHDANVYVRRSILHVFVQNNTSFVDVYKGTSKVRRKKSGTEAIVKQGSRAQVIPGEEDIRILDLENLVRERMYADSSTPAVSEDTITQLPSIAMLAVHSTVANEEDLNTFSNFISTKIDETHDNVNVVYYDNVQRMLRAEGKQHMIDCFTDSCLSHIASQLGVDMVVLGNIGKMGSRYLFNLKLIDVFMHEVTNRAQASVKDDMGKLFDEVPGMVEKLVSDDIVERIVKPGVRRRKPSDRKKTPCGAPAGMICIPGGEYQMGSPIGEGEPDEWPRHTVRVDSFYMDMYEVTKRAFEKVMGYRAGTKQGCPTCPVSNVSWFEAKKYCRKVGKRLPTEAEWEYACRAGTQTAFHYGNSISSRLANFDGRKPYGGSTQSVFRGVRIPVGSFEPNDYGLYDMHGNVMEWCADWYGQNYYKQSQTDEPKGAKDGKYRVVRGGGFLSEGKALRCANRLSYDPSVRLKTIGFRCVKDVE
jgi:formylglycine-generating enzyme required for sulfatase activity